MAPLPGKTIIYDDNCPMCAAYTGTFIKFGLLEQEGRMGFEHVSKEISCQLDLDRARHEIPLLDRATGQVMYGKEALFLILGHRFPVLKPLFRFAPFRMLIHVLYQIITYNRRVIVGPQGPSTGFDCAPDFHLGWRWTYIMIVMSWAFYLIMRFAQESSIFENIGLAPHYFAMGYLAAFAILFPLIGKVTTSKIGQIATIALIGALVLLPVIWIELPAIIIWTNITVALFFIGKEMKRRWELVK